MPAVCRRGITANRGTARHIRFTIGVPSDRGNTRPALLPVSSGFPVRSCVHLYSTTSGTSTTTLTTTEGTLRSEVLNRTGRVHGCVGIPGAAPCTVVCLTARKLCTRVTSSHSKLPRGLRGRCGVVVTKPVAVATLLGSLSVNFGAITVGRGTGRIEGLLTTYGARCSVFNAILRGTGGGVSSTKHSLSSTRRHGSVVRGGLHNIRSVRHSRTRGVLSVSRNFTSARSSGWGGQRGGTKLWEAGILCDPIF